MNSTAVVVESYPDPDPDSIFVVGIWFAIVAVLGIPLNLFIIVSTLTVKSLRDVPINFFLFSLSVADTMFLVGFAMHLPYALTFNTNVCKVSAMIIYIFGTVSNFIPPFLAMNRYAVVCSPQQKLASYLRKLFTRNGIYLMNTILWICQTCYILPFAIFDTLGLGVIGTCNVVGRNADSQIFFSIYFLIIVLFVLLSNVIVFIFYRKMESWVKSMSTGMTLTSETRETLIETKNLMQMTKWIAIIPFLFSSPATLLQFALKIDSTFVSVRFCRACVCLFPICPLINPILTLKFARPYRIVLRNWSKKTRITAVIFSAMFRMFRTRSNGQVMDILQTDGQRAPIYNSENV
jgi:hypothetical protein